MPRRRPKTGDPLLDEIYEIRWRIWAEADYDRDKWIANLLEYQKQFADRLVDYSNESRPRRDGGAGGSGDNERA
jgi:hypothetical protein